MADIKTFFPTIVTTTQVEDDEGNPILVEGDMNNNAKLNGDVAHVDGTVILSVGEDDDDVATFQGDIVNGDTGNMGADGIILNVGDEDTVSTFRGNILNQNNTAILVPGDPDATPAVPATFAGSSNMVDVYDDNDLDPTAINRVVVINMSLDDYEDLTDAEIRDDALYLLS